jgi:hypothetical protein
MTNLDQEQRASLKKMGIIAILIALLLLAVLMQKADAQDKHLPPVVHFTLTDVQMQAIQAKIDSCSFFLSTRSDLPANLVYQFTQRLYGVFQPMAAQMQSQLISDKAIVPDTVKKNTGKVRKP